MILIVKFNWKLIFNIISLMFPIGIILYFFLSEQGFMDLFQNITKLNISWLILGLFLQGLNFFIDAYTLYKFTNYYDSNYNIKKALKTMSVGQFYSAITPAAVGGQPMQLYCMKKQNINTGIASSCLLQKFLVYQTVITFYSLIAMLLNYNLFSGEFKDLMFSLALFGFLSHAITVIFIFVISINKNLALSIIKYIFKILTKIRILKNSSDKLEKIKQQINFFNESNSKLYNNKKLLFITISLTVLQLTCMFSIPYTIYRAFNFNNASIFDMITGQSFVTMVSAFIPLPGGTGAAEGSFYVFFKMFFMENTIKSAILLWRIITYFFTIIIFAPFSNVNSIKKEYKNQ